MNAPTLLQLGQVIRDEVNPRRITVGLPPLSVDDLDRLHAHHVAFRKQEAAEEAWNTLVSRTRERVALQPNNLLTEASQPACDATAKATAS